MEDQIKALSKKLLNPSLPSGGFKIALCNLLDTIPETISDSELPDVAEVMIQTIINLFPKKEVDKVPDEVVVKAYILTLPEDERLRRERYILNFLKIKQNIDTFKSIRKWLEETRARYPKNEYHPTITRTLDPEDEDLDPND